MSDPASHGCSARPVCPTCGALFHRGFRRCPRDGVDLELTTRDPLVGTVLAERYQIEALLGEGGIGRVYRARHVRMSRRFAVKVPFGDLAASPKQRLRFANEAEAASRVSHPNVIGVVDFGETPAGLLYLVMDLAEGRSLRSAIDDEGALASARAAAIIAQLADGLAHAHARGLVHRDLKPDNVIVSTAPGGGERAQIVDFGIAVLQDAAPSERLTTEGIVIGTPAYMAPEQATGQVLDHRADIFALGQILYEMLAGVQPFAGSPIEIARQNLTCDPPPIAERAPGRIVDPRLEALARWMIARDPEDRPADAAIVAEIARGVADGDAVDPRLIPSWVGEPPAAVAVPARLPARPAPALDADVADDGADEGHVTVAVTRSPRLGTLDEAAAERHSRRTAALPARRAGMLAVAFGGLAVIAGLVWRVASQDAAPRADAPRAPAGDVTPATAAPAVPPAATEPVAAPPVAPAAPTVAAPALAPAAPEPAPAAKGSKRRRVAPGPRDRGARPAPAAAPNPTVDTATDATTREATSASLTARYREVGAALDRAIRSHGADDPRVASIARRYRAIAYAEAIRKPALRAEALEELRRIAADLAGL